MTDTTTAAQDTAPAQAKRKPTFGRKTCAECGEKFTAGSPRSAFCTPAHKLAFHNRSKGRSAAISYAMAYRLKRGKKGVGAESFKELCRLLDLYNAEDREAGRPSAADYVEGMMRRDVFGEAWESRAHRGRAND